MKNENLAGLYLIFGLAIAATLGFALWMIGADFVRVLAVIMVAGVTIALILVASAFPVRAWRMPHTPPPVVEKHIIHDGTRTVERHTLDGRTALAPRLFQLPSQPQATGFPELLRAAYQSGMSTERADDLPVDAEVRRLPDRDEAEFDSWGGEIMP